MAASDQQGTARDGAPPPAFDEVQWVVRIRQSLEEGAAGGDGDGDGDDDDTSIPVSVFNVPKALRVHKPEAYTPQLIALGPYHHWRPELYEMERYKLASSTSSGGSSAGSAPTTTATSTSAAIRWRG